MKNILAIKVLASTAWTIPILFANPAIAAPNDSPPAVTNRFDHPFGSLPPSVETSLNSSYTLPGAAKIAGGKLGNSGAFELRLGVRGSVPIDENWTWSWEAGSQNIFLDSIAGAPLPKDINTLSFNTGVGYRLSDRWTVRGLVGSSLYRLEDVAGDSFGFSGGVLATYQANAALTWTFGLMVAPDSDLPVLPAVGVRWLINDQFTLTVGIPHTRLTYRADPESKWTLHAGLDMTGATFRTDKNFGTDIGSPRYNNVLATYRDIRLGVGASYQITEGFRAELEVGGSVYRTLGYKDIDGDVKFDPAPYVRLGLSYRF